MMKILFAVFVLAFAVIVNGEDKIESMTEEEAKIYQTIPEDLRNQFFFGSHETRAEIAKTKETGWVQLNPEQLKMFKSLTEKERANYMLISLFHRRLLTHIPVDNWKELLEEDSNQTTTELEQWIVLYFKFSQMPPEQRAFAESLEDIYGAAFVNFPADLRAAIMKLDEKKRVEMTTDLVDTELKLFEILNEEQLNDLIAAVMPAASDPGKADETKKKLDQIMSNLSSEQKEQVKQLFEKFDKFFKSIKN